MQAIARVNRVFGDKEGGLVDYIGIAQGLEKKPWRFIQKARAKANWHLIRKRPLPG